MKMGSGRTVPLQGKALESMLGISVRKIQYRLKEYAGEKSDGEAEPLD